MIPQRQANQAYVVPHLANHTRSLVTLHAEDTMLLSLLTIKMNISGSMRGFAEGSLVREHPLDGPLVVRLPCGHPNPSYTTPRLTALLADLVQTNPYMQVRAAVALALSSRLVCAAVLRLPWGSAATAVRLPGAGLQLLLSAPAVAGTALQACRGPAGWPWPAGRMACWPHGWARLLAAAGCAAPRALTPAPPLTLPATTQQYLSLLETEHRGFPVISQAALADAIKSDAARDPTLATGRRALQRSMTQVRVARGLILQRAVLPPPRRLVLLAALPCPIP